MCCDHDYLSLKELVEVTDMRSNENMLSTSLGAKLIILDQRSTCLNTLGFWRLHMRYAIAPVRNG